MMQEVLLWDDNPSGHDLLGFADVAAPMLAAIRSNHLDPVCLGVFGAWGSGKTTVVDLLRRELADDDSIILVYTQPWAYDPATDPKATLIGEVLTAVRDRVVEDATALSKLGDRLKSLASRVRWSRAIRLAAQSALTATLPNLSDLQELFGKDDEVSEPTLEGFRAEFAELLADEALNSVVRVVVVVDDLDRCLPPTVVDTLEAIKLFLAVPKMAFVIAADEVPVARAIAARIGLSGDASDLATKYLEKIVQIPVRVPALGQADVEAYVAQLLLWHRLEGKGERFEELRVRCADARAAGARTLLDGVADDIEGGDADIVLAERLAPILYEELEGNPRRIKRLLNAYWVRAAIARRRGVAFEVAAFAKLVLLEEVYPVAFGTVLSWLSAGNLEDQLRNLEGGEGEFSAELRRWAGLDPPLADANVGGYLVLAATLTGTTVTAASLPTNLREIAGRLTSTRDQERKAARAQAGKLGLEERSQLAHHLADTIRFQPSRQHPLAESLMAVVDDSEDVASSAVAVLKRMQAGSVEPALVVTLAPPSGKGLAPFRALVEAWSVAEELSDEARRAAQLALEVNS